MALGTLAGFQGSMDTLAAQRFSKVVMALEADLRLIHGNLLRESSPGEDKKRQRDSSDMVPTIHVDLCPPYRSPGDRRCSRPRRTEDG